MLDNRPIVDKRGLVALADFLRNKNVRAVIRAKRISLDEAEGYGRDYPPRQGEAYHEYRH
jgi:hypothetical protein